MDPDFENVTELHHALYDPGFETHRRFLADAPRHLADAGRVLLGFSDIGSWTTLRALCAELGLTIAVLRSECRRQNQPVEFQLLEITGFPAPGGRR
jgi:release factor glutamine methyltransferase